MSCGRMIWLSPSASCLSQSSCVSPVALTDGRGGRRGGAGANSNDREKAWSSPTHSILPGSYCRYPMESIKNNSYRHQCCFFDLDASYFDLTELLIEKIANCHSSITLLQGLQINSDAQTGFRRNKLSNKKSLWSDKCVCHVCRLQKC